MAENMDMPPDTEPQEPVSLEELAQAFAQVMGTAPKPRPVPQDPAADQPAKTRPAEEGGAAVIAHPDEAEAPETTSGPGDDVCPISPRTILEAMLFVGDRNGQPLTADRAAELMRGVEAAEIPRLVEELNQRYDAGGCPYHIVADAMGYRLTLRDAFDGLRNKFYGRIREARLSQAAIDILAIVAYQQPLTADQIGKLRGKPSGHVLSQLVHRGLLRIERKPGKQRITQYFTTDRFLELFGLQTLADLPQSEEVER